MKVFSQLLLLSLSLLRLYTAKAWVSTALRTNHNKQFQFSTPTLHDSKAPCTTSRISNTILQQTPSNENEDMLTNVDNGISWLQENSKIVWTSTITTMLVLAPSIANAAAAVSTKAGPGNKIYSAAVSYGHYVSLFIIVACVTIERFTIRPNMTLQEEKSIAKAEFFYEL